MAPPTPPTRNELEAWAQEAFPEDFALFKAEIDKIMTPTSYPYGYDPDYPAGPKPEYRDWECPTKVDRVKLNMEKHLILIIGTFKRRSPGGKMDKLFIYMTPGWELKFGRQVFDGKLAQHWYLSNDQATTGKDVNMFPFWRGIHLRDPNFQHGRLIKAVAVYLHMLRELLPDSRGRFEVKEHFEAAVKACAEHCRNRDRPQLGAPPPSQVTTKPAAQAAPLPSQVRADGNGMKRGRGEDVGPQERTKRVKGPEDRVKELEEKLKMVEEANAKQVKELKDRVSEVEQENKQLKEEVSGVKAEVARKDDQLATIQSVLGDQYRQP
ncbi:uncharacterized protein N0V89_008013 [Didymosphaeria variabile]|uniref:Uncharacterized protein n=1 Tax=Didymosphaeria variabile TaxID=1932322 RepID=A0A9W8XFH0_9PLEO|nr:uncharacterized protein N0V89_008013 [Didymosphaeria variabile]KAJ4349398.1 hypothetical protein N0V89_008013 [Didymosphaeria variabile]